MNSSSLLEILSWDTEFFRRRIARILPDELSASSLNQIFSEQCDQRVDCLYFLADPNKSESIRLAENNGFHLMDIRIVLECRDLSGNIPEQIGIRPFTRKDRKYLHEIARASFRDSRFYFDPHFSAQKCDELYELWIDKDCDDDTCIKLVSECDGQAVGFITCYRKSGEGKISLVGVNANFRGRGYGQSLVNASRSWLAREGIGVISVVTQGRNIHAQRLYQKCGFFTRSSYLWYHWWNEAKIKENPQ